MLQTALKQAAHAARRPYAPLAPMGKTFLRRVALGDPQAPLVQVLAILDHYGLLGEEGWLATDVQLVSLGDHFDWGNRRERAQATEQGLQLLAWLAAHPPDQVILLLGNHDLGRVGELAGFNEAHFTQAQREAAALYPTASSEQSKDYLNRYPAFPSVEVPARDLACFSIAQRQLVKDLLLTGRFQAAFAADRDLLLCHAGFTQAYVAPAPDAPTLAAAVNAILAAAVEVWGGVGPLSIPGLHQPGSAAFGEGGGVFYHRPTHPSQGGGARRFDPRTIPLGLTQVVGHTQDKKCRQLLGPWAKGDTPPGALRHLWTDGTTVVYQAGVPQQYNPHHGQLIFADGAMAHVDPSVYQLLDLATRQAFRS